MSSRRTRTIECYAMLCPRPTFRDSIRLNSRERASSLLSFHSCKRLLAAKESACPNRQSAHRMWGSSFSKAREESHPPRNAWPHPKGRETQGRADTPRQGPLLPSSLKSQRKGDTANRSWAAYSDATRASKIACSSSCTTVIVCQYLLQFKAPCSMPTPCCEDWRSRSPGQHC